MHLLRKAKVPLSHDSIFIEILTHVCEYRNGGILFNKALIVAVLLCQYSSKDYLKFYCRKQVCYLENASCFLFCVFNHSFCPCSSDGCIVTLAKGVTHLYDCCCWESRIHTGICMQDKFLFLGNNCHCELNGSEFFSCSGGQKSVKAVMLDPIQTWFVFYPNYIKKIN